MLAPGKYYVGTLIRISVSFADGNGDAVDPDTVVFKAMSRFGTDVTYTYGTDSQLGKSSTGNYYADLSPDAPGRWYYRWQTTGTGTTLATEDNFIVQDSPFYDWPRTVDNSWFYT